METLLSGERGELLTIWENYLDKVESKIDRH